jgi:hypothetical protein
MTVNDEMDDEDISFVLVPLMLRKFLSDYWLISLSTLIIISPSRLLKTSEASS